MILEVGEVYDLRLSVKGLLASDATHWGGESRWRDQGEWALADLGLIRYERIENRRDDRQVTKIAKRRNSFRKEGCERLRE